MFPWHWLLWQKACVCVCVCVCEWVRVCACLDMLVVQSCPTLCDPMDYSLPGSSAFQIHPIFSWRRLWAIRLLFTSDYEFRSQNLDHHIVYCQHVGTRSVSCEKLQYSDCVFRYCVIYHSQTFQPWVIISPFQFIRSLNPYLQKVFMTLS